MVWQKQEEEGCKSLIMTAAILGALLGTFWSRGHQEGRMSTRDLASIKWRERETPQGLLLATRRLSFFLAFFELSKYVYIYRLQPFLLHEQTIAAGWQFHKLVWKGKILDFFLPFFYPWLVTASAVHPSLGLDCQVSVGNQIKLCDDLTDSLLVSLFLLFSQSPP